MSIEYLEVVSEHNNAASTDGSKGDDIKDQIVSLREGLSDAKFSELCGETLIDPKKGLKSVARVGKKESYKFDKAELGAALDELNE